MVLPVLYGKKMLRRRAADQEVEGDDPAYGSDTEELPAGRPELPEKAAPGAFALGL